MHAKLLTLLSTSVFQEADSCGSKDHRQEGGGCRVQAQEGLNVRRV
jgi:hypothetical protein